MRLRLIAGNFKIIKMKPVNGLRGAVYGQLWQRSRLTRQLFAGLVKMICVKMCITQYMHKLASLKTANSGDHMGQQRIRGNVEGHPQKNMALR